MKSFASRALNSEDKKELLTLQEKRDVAGAKYDSVLDQLKRFESIVVATSPPYDLPTKLQEQRANDAERVARLENTIATARKQREVYQIDNKIVVGSAFWPFPKLHSDYLLALSIMTCSALGALIVGLRGSNPTSLKDVTLGIASGFVCYFAIKGGKYVFLLTTHSELVSFNPYGSAFAGLLVGLFSERVYGLLSMLVGDLEKRLQLALASNDAAPRVAIHDGHTERMGGPALVANQPLPPPQARLG